MYTVNGKTTYEPQVECYVAQVSIAIDRAEFIMTNLEKWTSYEHETKSRIKLKESANFETDFKPNINSTAKL